MINRRTLLLAWLAILVAGLIARAGGIPEDDALEKRLSRSHLIEGFDLPPIAAEDLFLQRLKTIHTKEIGEGVGKQLNREDLDNFRENQQKLEDFLKTFKFDKLPDELKKKFAGREAD